MLPKVTIQHSIHFYQIEHVLWRMVYAVCLVTPDKYFIDQLATYTLGSVYLYVGFRGKDWPVSFLENRCISLTVQRFSRESITDRQN